MNKISLVISIELNIQGTPKWVIAVMSEILRKNAVVVVCNLDLFK